MNSNDSLEILFLSSFNIIQYNAVSNSEMIVTNVKRKYGAFKKQI